MLTVTVPTDAVAIILKVSTGSFDSTLTDCPRSIVAVPTEAVAALPVTTALIVPPSKSKTTTSFTTLRLSGVISL
mgnify:CR=1 FL=1